jgi:hypothetical protein
LLASCLLFSSVQNGGGGFYSRVDVCFAMDFRIFFFFLFFFSFRSHPSFKLTAQDSFSEFLELKGKKESGAYGVKRDDDVVQGVMSLEYDAKGKAEEAENLNHANEVEQVKVIAVRKESAAEAHVDEHAGPEVGGKVALRATAPAVGKGSFFGTREGNFFFLLFFFKKNDQVLI